MTKPAEREPGGLGVGEVAGADLRLGSGGSVPASPPPSPAAWCARLPFTPLRAIDYKRISLRIHLIERKSPLSGGFRIESLRSTHLTEERGHERTNELQPPNFTRTVLAAQAAGRPVASHVGQRGLGDAFVTMGGSRCRGHRDMHVAVLRVSCRPRHIGRP